MNYERQMKILRERHGIQESDFKHVGVYRPSATYLHVGAFILEQSILSRGKGILVFSEPDDGHSLHNWVAAVTYAKARDAARRAKDKTP